MGKILFYGGLLIITLNAGCNGYAKFKIDEKPVTKTDSGLLGIWKAVEDTDKANFVLLQSPYDMFDRTRFWFNLDSIGRRNYIDKNFSERHLFQEFIFLRDTSAYFQSYADFLKDNHLKYFMTYMNFHGENPKYSAWSATLSAVKKTRFLNIKYRYAPLIDEAKFTFGDEEDGYFFVRLISVNATYDTVTTAIVADPQMKLLKSSKEVRVRIEKNINNSSFYSDTMHFYKVSSYHASQAEAIKKAN
jgi:hypothetical protein